ncbi:glycosyltransferase [Methylocystis bryophila]|uniref:Erythromycin biosynthesis protein CIII-like C-terminal domain-containing protein n=1 Tax=Methylocystis bryophila TaxID=655015 RepID=A0A1W6N2B6_9HYPH|nr:glycosyltransferase [Methylocystis bryophila]ARN83977.1 hypothetical protein B1812_22155 [Methylocystis bryophila]
MARILFFVWPHFASVASGLKLARDLLSRGHEVSYVGVADCKTFVVAHGHQFIPLYARWLPETPTDSAHETATDQNFWDQLRSARARVRTVRALLDALVADEEREFQEILKLKKPDLLIIHISDFEVIIPSLLAYEAGIKCAYLYDNFGRSEDCRVPPVRTAILPNGGRGASLRLWLAWKILKIRRRVAGDVYGLLGLAYLPALREASRRIAERCRYPCEFVDSTDLAPLKAHLPEIVLCPPELEFPHHGRPGRYYFGCNIDLHRNEGDFPWSSLDTRPLVYCSLGTMSWFNKDVYQRFFRIIIAVAEHRPEFQWVVNVYDVVNPEEFENVPQNVHLVKRAPQLAILQRSAVAIVHGGPNTVKECAYFGVPMIVFPLGLDQPGTAARVVYHGLGVSGDFCSVTKEQMDALVDRVDRDSFVRVQTRLIGETLRAADLERSPVDFVEKLLDPESENSGR